MLDQFLGGPHPALDKGTLSNSWIKVIGQAHEYSEEDI